ncbi:hypothetical protein [Streptomyces boluensis]|uniref:Uncharacterized protein n=1 Tax=Streptomyces boluensis TaxID=1775135 RepID=A0A964XQC6_9ACTN|nr:hypothetical protein [Streptomyces boluensis]NBE55687.1 hypothetical protein [Streptomyces boluensis]
MKTKDRISWIALAVGLLIAGTAWATLQIADAVTETSLGKAPHQAGDVHLDPLKKGEVLAADRWPYACALVDQKDVEAILPDAEEVREEPPLHVYAPSIKEFAADPAWKRSDSADYGRCEYSMELPGETFAATRVWVRVDAVADPELIAGYYEDVTRSGDSKRFGADACANDGGLDDSWTCRKGSLMFTVGGQTTATFEGRMDSAPFVWRDDVGPEFVRAVTAKVS